MKNIGLNPEQTRAVLAEPAPLLVLAGAGSGKTRVLVARVAHFIAERNIEPHRILAVTFTNKAAREMQARLTELLGPGVRGAYIGTFHGLSHRILRQEAERMGIGENFQILDADDQVRTIKRLLVDLGLENRLEPKKVQHFINRHKDEGKRAKQVTPGFLEEAKCMQEVYAHYERYCERLSLIDFAELLLKVREWWHSDPSILQHYQERFSAIFVDEFQDTNPIQYAWLKDLSAKHRIITAVGDDDQSIYGWRGAKVENLKKLLQDFPETTVIRLEQNYRSTDVILKAANALIANNQGRLGKSLWTNAAGGELIQLMAAGNEMEEAFQIVEKIKDSAISYPDTAILYRSHAQSRVFEQALARFSIPFQIYGGLRFFDRAEIKDALAYLRLVANPHDDPAFLRAINMPPRGLGEKTIEAIQQHAKAHNLSLYSALYETLEQHPARRQTALRGFVQLLSELKIYAQHENLGSLTQETVKKSGLLAHYKADRSEIGEAKVENLNELFTAADIFGQAGVNTGDALLAFLAEVALDSGSGEGAQEGVKLMTLHAAKGLEFEQVFIAGLEEGLFPHHRSLSETHLLEEERRLCYVGITRAQKSLTLSYAERRAFAGRSDKSLPSRFIGEIPATLFQAAPQRLAPQFIPRAPAKETGPYATGSSVRHAVFGDGIVLDREGSGASLRLQVRFPRVGTKWLMVEMAKLEAL